MGINRSNNRTGYLEAISLLTASNIPERTFLRGNPEVGGPSVEDNHKILSWSPDGDKAVILSLKMINVEIEQIEPP